MSHSHSPPEKDEPAQRKQVGGHQLGNAPFSHAKPEGSFENSPIFWLFLVNECLDHKQSTPMRRGPSAYWINWNDEELAGDLRNAKKMLQHVGRSKALRITETMFSWK
jgi:hypothetical protein